MTLEVSTFIFAGPNGPGKSTAAPTLIGDELALTEFVNADVKDSATWESICAAHVPE